VSTQTVPGRVDPAFGFPVPGSMSRKVPSWTVVIRSVLTGRTQHVPTLRTILRTTESLNRGTSVFDPESSLRQERSDLDSPVSIPLKHKQRDGRSDQRAKTRENIDGHLCPL